MLFMVASSFAITTTVCPAEMTMIIAMIELMMESSSCVTHRLVTDAIVCKPVALPFWLTEDLHCACTIRVCVLLFTTASYAV